MRITTIQINLLVLALVLTGLQAVILYFVNGELVKLLNQNEFDQLAVIFAPTYAIIWALKNAGQNYKDS